MAPRDGQPGFRKVKPRKQKATPSRRRREARRLSERAERLTERVDEARADRRQSWPEGGQPEFATAAQERRLRELEDEKHGLRRELYDVAGVDEGMPFRKYHPYAEPRRRKR